MWTGAFSSEWSTAAIPSPKNWTLAVAGTPTDFIAGDAVDFNASASNQVVDISQADVAPSSVSFDSGSYTLKSTPGTFGIAGSATVVINGGSLQITNVNSYTGGTTLNGGLLAFVNGGLGASGNITFAGSSTLQWASGNTQDLSGRLVINDGITATIDTQDNDVTFANSVGGTSSGTLAKSGSGTLTLAAPNAYTGGTLLNAGTLSFVSGGLGSSGAVTFAGDSTLQWASGNIDDLSGRLTVNDSVAATLDTQANNVTFATGIGGGSGSVTKIGTGTLRLNGNSTFTGGLNVAAGTLTANFNNTANLGGGTNPFVTVGGAGATLTLIHNDVGFPTNNAIITLDDGATLNLSTTTTTGGYTNALLTQPINVSGNTTINLTFSSPYGSRGTEFELNSTTPANVTLNLVAGGDAVNSGSAGWRLYTPELDQPAQLAAGSTLTINGGLAAGGCAASIEFRNGGLAADAGHARQHRRDLRQRSGVRTDRQQRPQRVPG